MGVSVGAVVAVAGISVAVGAEVAVNVFVGAIVAVGIVIGAGVQEARRKTKRNRECFI